MGQRPLVMWSAVCSAPHSQLSFVDNPQRSMLAPNLPTPVRSLFSRVQARRDRPTPCPLFDGVGMNLCSLVVVMWCSMTAFTAYVPHWRASQCLASVRTHRKMCLFEVPPKLSRKRTMYTHVARRWGHQHCPHCIHRQSGDRNTSAGLSPGGCWTTCRRRNRTPSRGWVRQSCHHLRQTAPGTSIPGWRLRGAKHSVWHTNGCPVIICISNGNNSPLTDEYCINAMVVMPKPMTPKPVGAQLTVSLCVHVSGCVGMF